MSEEKLKLLDGYEKVSIKDSEEIATIVAEKALTGKVIIEEQQHEDGHFLIFVSEQERLEKEKQSKTLEDRIGELENRVAQLEKM